jgi:hypothetical protein
MEGGGERGRRKGLVLGDSGQGEKGYLLGATLEAERLRSLRVRGRQET